MRLLWKKYDRAFHPIIATVGLGFFGFGVWGVVSLRRAPLSPVLWPFYAIPLCALFIGIVIVIREYELWKTR